MIGHGYYRRKPRDGLGVYPLLIKRWRCKECGRTVSVLPSFLLRYRQYLLRVIGAVLTLRYEGLASWAAILANVAEIGYPALRTIQRWCRSFREQAGRWLKAVQEWLAQQDSRSGWLDAQGDALKAGSPEQALLAASEHLLAWGKSHQAEIAEYGLDKRLHFLWLWGARLGLGRLV
jgi:transposase-like protein